MTYSDDILVTNLFLLQKSVSLVHLSIGTHKACEFFFNCQKSFFVFLGILIWVLLCQNFGVKHAWSKVLGVKDSYLFLIDQDKEKGFIKEET